MPSKDKLGNEIEEPNWGFLLESIHKGTCVPFLGAGANIGGSGPPIPTGAELALAIAKSLAGKDGKFLERVVRFAQRFPVFSRNRELFRLSFSDLARVSLHYRDQVGPKDFLDEMRRRILPAGSRPSALLRVLARLPLQLVITTNYDHMFETALREKPKLTVTQPLRGFPEKESIEVNRNLENFEGVRVYKIHGQLSPMGAPKDIAGATEDSPIIITEEDYVRFMTILRDPQRGVPKWVESQLRDSRLLFLGYGLEDWDFRTLFEGLIAPIPTLQRPTSYAIQRNPSPFWVKYWERRGVRIYDMDLRAFARELVHRYRGTYGAQTTSGKLVGNVR